MKKPLLVGGILLLVLALVAVGIFVVRPRLQDRSAQSVTVTTATVARGSIEQTVSATGNVAAEQRASLSFSSTGKVVGVSVVKGQAVQTDDEIARLDTTALERQVARAQASLQTTRARLQQAQRPANAEEIASAEAVLASAQAAYDRVKAGPLPEEIAYAQAAYDSAVAFHNTVKAGATAPERTAAEAALVQAEANVQEAQAAYDAVKNSPIIGMLPQSLELQSATNALIQARANYDTLLARPTPYELASAKAQMLQAQSALAQIKARPTASELASANAQVAQAQAALAQLRSLPDADALAVAQATYDEAQLALEQAQAQLDEAILRAPFDGIIVALSVAAGQYATPGSPAAVVDSAGSFLLDVSIDEVDVSELAEGQAAHLTFTALPGQTVDGTVEMIAPAATNQSGAQAYQVQIAFAPGDLPVRIGMTADVQIVTAAAADALIVPSRAVTADREAGRYFATRQLTSGLTEQVEVRIGLRDAANVQILDGVDEGDILVLPEIPGAGSFSSSPFSEFRPGGDNHP
ncbi:MAG TPA: efflux RND transporter periplasmic adaptor subunit [Anaerolineae bacterium]|nr:efflux RND transporter periplasmic adaptor subunit [Anaerolineae bacterium]